MLELKDYLIKEAEKWPSVKVYYREDWCCMYFDIMGKFFALYGKNQEAQQIITLKGNPEKNELLREQYPFVIPGYHTNKTHWNSIVVAESSFSQGEYLNLLKESYDLTVAKLPKKVRDHL